jgi:hypothetical protein
VIASAPGFGSFVLANDRQNPVDTPLPGTTGGFFTAEIAPGSSFSGLKLLDADLGGGGRLMAWNGSAWIQLPNQTYSAGPPPSISVTIPVGSALLKLSRIIVAPALPSNLLIPPVRIRPWRNGRFTVSVKPPGPGRVDVLITA